jgi:hypothetical protein
MSFAVCHLAGEEDLWPTEQPGCMQEYGNDSVQMGHLDF